MFPDNLSLEDAEGCAAACKHLLASLDALDQQHQKLRIKLQYRLNLTPAKDSNSNTVIDGGWRMWIKLESVAWFDWLRAEKDDNTAILTGRSLVDGWRDEIRQRGPVDPPLDEVVQIRDYCYKGNLCSCKKEHPRLMSPCEENISRADGQRQCLWCFADELMIQANGTISTKLYDAANMFGLRLGCRREVTRDLLLAPVNHMRNIQYAVYVETWQCIAKVYSIIVSETKVGQPVQGVGINFGKWETGNSNDTSKYAVDCHAHLHLILSRAAIDILCKEAGCKGLCGRVEDPEDHLLRDCNELETNRILSLEHKTLDKKVDNLSAEVKGLSVEVKELKRSLDTLITLITEKL